MRHVATGGGPLNIRNNITLCADSAVNVAGQGYSGSLLELAIWNQALSEGAIKAFYKRVRSKCRAQWANDNVGVQLSSYLIKASKQICFVKGALDGLQ